MVDYIVCPLCGLNRVLHSPKRAEKGRSETASFTHLNPMETFTLIQQREGGGGKQPGKSGKKGRGRAPGVGFPTTNTLTLSQIARDPAYKEVLEDLSQRLVKIVKSFKQEELVTSDELST